MKLIPAAAIFTTASLGFACGAGTSAYSITSGPPVCLIKTAFIVLLDRIAPLKNATRRSSLGIRFEPIGWFSAVRRSRWHLVLPQTGSREQRTGIGNSNDGCHDTLFPHSGQNFVPASNFLPHLEHSFFGRRAFPHWG